MVTQPKFENISILFICPLKPLIPCIDNKYVGRPWPSGHLLSSGTWPVDTEDSILDRSCIVNESAWGCPTVVEVISLKHIGVMTMTFLGRVTSSVAW